jgi:hypothetical protein
MTDEEVDEKELQNVGNVQKHRPYKIYKFVPLQA